MLKSCLFHNLSDLHMTISDLLDFHNLQCLRVIIYDPFNSNFGYLIFKYGLST